MMTTPSDSGPTMASEVRDAALRYEAAGISIIPIAPDGSKSPAWCSLPKVDRGDGTYKHAWKPFQQRRPTPEEIARWYSGWGPACGVAVIGGGISGGLEIIDFDTIELFEPWCELVGARYPDVLERLVLVRTPRPGMHAYYRCDAFGTSQKLARRLERSPKTSLLDIKALIETKGEGGYCLVPPSPAHCHPTGRRYAYVTDRDLTNLASITSAEREILFAAARSFDEPPPSTRAVRPNRQPRRPLGTAGSELPGEDFNARGDWAEILDRNEWTYIGEDGSDKQLWCRPGKTDGTSATVNYEGNGLLHVFSSSVAQLEQDKSYSKFQFVALVEHGGDFKKAARALQLLGYGRPRLHTGKRRRRPDARTRRRRS